VQGQRRLPRDLRPVSGHVVLSHPSLVLEEADELGADAVLRLGEVAPALLTRDAALGDGMAQLRPKIMGYLLGLDRRPDAEEPRQIMQYTVLGPLDVRGNARVLGAFNPAGESVLLYCVPTVNASDQAQAELLATREHDALAELAVEDRTWRVQGWFDWEGYRVTPVIPAMDGTNLRKLAATAQPPHDSDHRVPPDVAAAIVHDAFVALTSVHAKGIMHRALQPRSIEVTPADRVRFCDFSRSRVPNVGTIAPTLNDDHPSAAFRPPGCTLEFFQPKDDVYSLALCLVQWIHGDARDHPDHVLARERADAYPGVGPILSRCLASDHDERPDAAEVAAATGRRRAVSTPPDVMAIGTLVDGRYRLLRGLGEGAWARDLARFRREGRQPPDAEAHAPPTSQLQPSEGRVRQCGSSPQPVLRPRLRPALTPRTGRIGPDDARVITHIRRSGFLAREAPLSTVITAHDQFSWTRPCDSQGRHCGGPQQHG
jgi:hypothetical protein